MPKYYVKSNTVEKIVSLNVMYESSPLDAALCVFNDTNEFDIFDEYFYVDERGMKDYTSADRLTQVIKTSKVITKSAEHN